MKGLAAPAPRHSDRRLETAISATFVYDGDGNRVKSVIVGGATTYYVGNYYEVTGSTITKYYYAGSQRIAMRTCTGGTCSAPTYLLSDQLGSTSLTLDSSGNVLSELRYKAWGEVRYAAGTTATKYTYTGQYSNIGDFGLMFYNARWYDPYLGRFAQADSIVPRGVQGWDRYAYINNNPVNGTDPTGHRNCEEDGYNCPGDDWGNSRNKGEQGPDWEAAKENGYSDWEIRALQRLYKYGGSNAVYGVDYMLSHGIHVTVGSGLQSAGGSRAAWPVGNDLIVLNADNGYSLDTMPDDWGLSLIIHEAKHIEQGRGIALSKFGEMEAWQIGIDVADHLGWYRDPMHPLTGRDLAVMKAETIEAFSNAIRMDKGYWNALTEYLPDAITDLVCIGFCSLPDWPPGWSSGP